ncbi:hypothetical protein GPECTOR_48g408 [Gonium pectorale]|uniref:Uncharacterized protein n=1 Tax=Gonium pectorale TaxID=33097 RepID=A0A150G7Z1_GONPE|nr:hypothetical protein GPECTOR_48g408 [Gonium pectorale]|eukprot:KXZ45976.1 hypothetical protein GPECTOR_48g408 [Gonium pectorale]
MVSGLEGAPEVPKADNRTVPTGAYGYAIAHMWLPLRSGLSQVQFRVYCKSCKLYVQGVLVAEYLQTLTPGVDGGELSLAESGCINLTAPNTAPNATAYTLELRFAMSDLTTNTGPTANRKMVVKKSSGTGSVADVTYRACTNTGSIAQRYAWASAVDNLNRSAVAIRNQTAKLVRGRMCCDVWALTEDQARLDSAVPSRLDRRPNATAMFPLGDSTCVGASDNSPMAAKCKVRVKGEVFNTSWVDAAGSPRSDLPPVATNYGAFLPLLAFEYRAVGRQTTVTVYDGVDNDGVSMGPDQALAIDERMAVPEDDCR